MRTWLLVCLSVLSVSLFTSRQAQGQAPEGPFILVDPVGLFSPIVREGKIEVRWHVLNTKKVVMATELRWGLSAETVVNSGTILKGSGIAHVGEIPAPEDRAVTVFLAVSVILEGGEEIRTKTLTVAPRKQLDTTDLITDVEEMAAEFGRKRGLDLPHSPIPELSVGDLVSASVTVSIEWSMLSYNPTTGMIWGYKGSTKKAPGSTTAVHKYYSTWGDGIWHMWEYTSEWPVPPYHVARMHTTGVNGYTSYDCTIDTSLKMAIPPPSRPGLVPVGAVLCTQGDYASMADPTVFGGMAGSWVMWDVSAGVISAIASNLTEYTYCMDAPMGQELKVMPPVKLNVWYAEEEIPNFQEYLGTLCGCPCRSVGSTLNLANGNLVDSVPTARTSSGLMPLDLTLTFNSLDRYEGRLGPHWTHTYNTNLDNHGDTIIVMAGDGLRIPFHDDGTGVYVPESRFGQHATLIKNPGDTYTMTDTYGNKTHFRSNGQITEMEDRNGNQITTTYDGNKLIEVMDPAGRKITLGYNADGKLSVITDPAGSVWQLTYQAGNLVAIKNPSNATRTFEYNADGRMTAKTDEANNRTQYTYDAQGKVATATDALNNAESFSYDEENGLAAVTDKRGNVERYTYNADLNVKLSEQDPLGNTTTYAWSEGRDMVSSRDALGNTTSNAYDSAGNLVSTTDQLGRTTRYEYDATLNQVTRIVDPSGAETSYEYDAAGNRTKTTDALGNETTYTYNEAGQLLTTATPMGYVTTRTYDAAGNLQMVADPLGNITTYSYNSLGALQKDTDALGNETAYEYDSLGKLVRTTDAQGNQTLYCYDGLGNRTATVAPGNKVTSYTYDGKGRLLTSTDPEGNVTTYVYDAAGNRVASIDAEGRRTEYVFDAANRLTSARAPNGDTTQYTYDAAGNRLTVTDPAGAITRYTYDAAGQVTAVTDAQSKTTTYGYDVNGRRISSTDPEGNVTQTVYDALGRAVAQRDAEGGTTQYVYDADGRQVEVVDALERSTVYEYDAGGRVVAVTDALGKTTTYSYDVLGRVHRVTDANGNVTVNTYDALGRLVAVTDAEGRTTRFEYDVRGNKITDIAPDGATTYYTYYGNNQLMAVTDPVGNVTLYEYDRAGRQTAVIDAEGNRTENTYDDNGRLVAVKNAEGHVTQYEYDSRGNVVRVIDANENAMAYEYDALGRVVVERDALGKETRYEYDSAGRMVKKTDGKGAVTTYVYNARGQMIKRTNPGGKEEEWEYDLAGNEVRWVSWIGEITKEYDRANRLRAESVNGKVSTHEYDANGNRIKMVDQFGYETAYEYNARNHMVRIVDPEGYVTEYQYDVNGRRVRADNDNGTWTTYSYDIAGRLVELRNVAGRGEKKDRLISSFTYTYDGLGNRTSMEEPTERTSYTYDRLGQLVQAEQAEIKAVVKEKKDKKGTCCPNVREYKKNWRIDYVYDGVGNRVRQDVTVITGESGCQFEHPFSHTRTYGYNAADELVEERTGCRRGKDVPEYVVRYAYDGNGNQISRECVIKRECAKYWDGVANGKTEYGYDHQNQIVQIQYPNGQVNTFVNCPCATRRVKKVDSTGTTKYTFDQGVRVLHELDADGNLTARYTLGPRMDEIISKTEYKHSCKKGPVPYKTHWYHCDGLGSVTELTDTHGDVVERYRYLPFGQLKQAPAQLLKDSPAGPPKHRPAPRNTFTYTGRDFDQDSALYYYRARYMNPTQGRFMQRDPVKGQPRYQYVRNNPATYTDPTGLAGCCGSTGDGRSIPLPPMNLMPPYYMFPNPRIPWVPGGQPLPLLYSGCDQATSDLINESIGLAINMLSASISCVTPMNSEDIVAFAPTGTPFENIDRAVSTFSQWREKFLVKANVLMSAISGFPAQSAFNFSCGGCGCILSQVDAYTYPSLSMDITVCSRCFDGGYPRGDMVLDELSHLYLHTDARRIGGETKFGPPWLGQLDVDAFWAGIGSWGTPETKCETLRRTIFDRMIARPTPLW